jgi:ectoine hydroxylase-related dioxygenase (phytanoyl-CoA dioxygenase family)
MDWIVAASASEHAEGRDAARAAFHEHGCILLRGALPAAAVEAMHREFMSRFGALSYAAMETEAAKPPPNRFLRVGGARYDIVVPMTGAFGNPEVFANDRLLGVLDPLLDRDVHLSNFSVVVSHPGATTQHAHRDSEHLFSAPGVGPGLPVYAVNVAVPLIDVDLRTGPTGVWLGSHRLPWGVKVDRQSMTVAALQRGDCMLLDYRTMHAGLPNASAQPRPIVYMVYARPWFFDHANHISRIPLDMPLEQYNRHSDVIQRLLIRAYSYAARTRWQEADGPAAQRPAVDPAKRAGGDPASLGKVGRNDPCPCGSGKKYKHCHGQIG